MAENTGIILEHSELKNQNKNEIKENKIKKLEEIDKNDKNFVSPNKKIKVSFKLNDKMFKRTGTFNTKPKNSFKECKFS